MTSTSIELPEGESARVFGEDLGDDDRKQAHEWLLQLAWPHYNRALAAERDGQVPKALAEARTAARYGTYAPRILKSAFLLAAKHGAFGFAQRLLNRIQDLGLEEGADYASLLRRRVERWNQFFGDTAALRETYQQRGATPSYRELLLLEDRLEESPTETEDMHLSAYGLQWRKEARSEGAEATEADPAPSPPTTQVILGLGAACLIGLLLGGGGFYLSWDVGGPEPAVDTLTTTPDSLVQAEQYGAVLQVGTFLADGQPVRAHQTLNRLTSDSARTEEADSLHAATHKALYRAGLQAWDTQNYEQVARVLTPIRDKPVGDPQAKRYYLGVAAAQTGQPALAVDVLRDLMPEIGEQYPHHEAQAAYLLAKHGPPEVARRHAQLIADKYADTVYFNSVVRSQLADGQ